MSVCVSVYVCLCVCAGVCGWRDIYARPHHHSLQCEWSVIITGFLLCGIHTDALSVNMIHMIPRTHINIIDNHKHTQGIHRHRHTHTHIHTYKHTYIDSHAPEPDNANQFCLPTMHHIYTLSSLTYHVARVGLFARVRTSVLGEGALLREAPVTLARYRHHW